jgi:hypothetical protein
MDVVALCNDKSLFHTVQFGILFKEREEVKSTEEKCKMKGTRSEETGG